MKLDNEPVEVGDSLYDLQFGPCTVKELTLDGRVVATVSGSRRDIVIDGGGFRKGSRYRMVYWARPVIVKVTKSELPGWPAVSAAISNIAGIMRATLKGGNANNG